LQTSLIEEIKWGVPVYTYNGANVLIVSAFKEYASLSFFKGALLSDPHKILTQQGNMQSNRLIKFTNVEEIVKLKDILNSYIAESIRIEDSGEKVIFEKNPEPIPEELQQIFELSPEFELAFNSLTPGRRRGYIIYFSQPKQSTTRIERIEKCKQQIFNGIGLNDKYKLHN